MANSTSLEDSLYFSTIRVFFADEFGASEILADNQNGDYLFRMENDRRAVTFKMQEFEFV